MLLQALYDSDYVLGRETEVVIWPVLRYSSVVDEDIVTNMK